MDEASELVKMSDERECHGYRKLCDAVGRVARHVANGDSVCAAEININIVVTRRGNANEFQFFRSRKIALIELYLVEHGNIGVRESFRNLIGCGEFVFGNIAESLYRLKIDVGTQSARVEYNYLHFYFPLFKNSFIGLHYSYHIVIVFRGDRKVVSVFGDLAVFEIEHDSCGSLDRVKRIAADYVIVFIY